MSSIWRKSSPGRSHASPYRENTGISRVRSSLPDPRFVRSAPAARFIRPFAASSHLGGESTELAAPRPFLSLSRLDKEQGSRRPAATNEKRAGPQPRQEARDLGPSGRSYVPFRSLFGGGRRRPFSRLPAAARGISLLPERGSECVGSLALLRHSSGKGDLMREPPDRAGATLGVADPRRPSRFDIGAASA